MQLLIVIYYLTMNCYAGLRRALNGFGNSPSGIGVP